MLQLLYACMYITLNVIYIQNIVITPLIIVILTVLFTVVYLLCIEYFGSSVWMYKSQIINEFAHKYQTSQMCIRIENNLFPYLFCATSFDH